MLTFIEDSTMIPVMEKPKPVSTVIRIPAELHAKLRWLSYQERRSQHSIIMEIMEKALRPVQVPKEEKE